MSKTKHTPGPWRWELNKKSRDIQLVGGIPKYDLTVVDFIRYGMVSAAPRFRTGDDLNIMVHADTLASVVPGREHHADWFQSIDHPDAKLIAAAPDMLTSLEEAKGCLDFLITNDQITCPPHLVETLNNMLMNTMTSIEMEIIKATE